MEENQGGAIQELATPDAIETTDIEQVTPDDGTVQVDEPQSQEQNAVFADNRRKQELEQTRAALLLEKSEKQRIEQERQQAENTLKMFFGEGDLSTLIDKAQAEATHQPLEAIQAQRTIREREQKELSDKNLKIQELEAFRRNTVMEKDLQSIQKLDPKVKTIDDLGAEFIEIMSISTDTGAPKYTAEQAYHMLMAIKQKAAPPSMGDVAKSPPAEKDFFTRDEVELMSQADVNKNYEKIRKSMEKWV